MKSILDFSKKKENKQSISMVTCYDYTFAKILNASEIDCVLVGDSVAMTQHGFSTTVNATMDMMLMHIQAVSRGLNNKFLIGDLPFLSYRRGLSHAMKAISAIMQAGAQAVKLEGAEGNLALIEHVVASGVPVMGHIGLTPQLLHQMGGYKIQGRDQKIAEKLLTEAKKLELSGCFAIVLECVVSDVAKKITESLNIPTIGIGSGVYTDGQVLVLQDLLGLNTDFQPKFVKKYIEGEKIVLQALNQFHQEVSMHDFPTEEHSFK
jgi:3-methyl-2-oxobutanoate hydroxymethyltransferase